MGDWTLNITLPDGREMEGCSVQSDGGLIAWQTLVDDAGNPLYNWLAEMNGRVGKAATDAASASGPEGGGDEDEALQDEIV